MFVFNKAILFIFEPFILFWKHRYMLIQTTRHDLKSRYAGSVLGSLWTFLYPLIFLSIYTVVYIFIFKVRFAHLTSLEYVMLIFCGLVPFLGFSEGISTATPSVVSNSTLIMTTTFPVEFIPVKSILTSACNQFVGILLLLLAALLLQTYSLWLFLVPVIFLLQVIMMIGLGWILSALNVYMRDVQTTIPLILIMLMMITPIAYTVDMIPKEIVPFLKFNPLYYLVVSFQEVLVCARWPRYHVLEVLIVISTLTFYAGYWFYHKIQRDFGNNV